MARMRLGRWHVSKHGVRPGCDGEPDFHYMRTYWLEVHWVDGEEVTTSGIDERPGIQFNTDPYPMMMCETGGPSEQFMPGDLEDDEM